MTSARRTGRLSPRQWLALAASVVVIAGIVVLYRTVDLKALRDHAAQFNPMLVIGAMFILPLLFVPVSVLQVLVGIRFGAAWGMAIVFASILFHLLSSFMLVRLFRARFERWLKRIRKKVPKGAHGPVTLFTLLLPGAPYAGQNYVLPVAGVPLKIFLRYAIPLHTARSVVAVVFGDQSNRLTPGRITVMAVYAVVLVCVCGWTYRRLRVKLGNSTGSAKLQPGAA